MAEADHDNEPSQPKFKRPKSDHSQEWKIINHSQPLTSRQRQKLEEYFQHIVWNASVDFNSQEIKDIQTAMQEMLERIKTRVNERGVFNIEYIVPAGSMVEKTSIWKDTSLEFDFLGVLKQSIKQCADKPDENDCNGCIRMDIAPIDFDQFEHYFKELDWETNSNKFRNVINYIFLNEINLCLTSDCEKHRLENVETERLKTNGFSRHVHAPCENCSVKKQTGTLYVSTQVIYGLTPLSGGCDSCSLKFQWISKEGSLTVPDPMLLQKPQPVSAVPIRVDFLPAIECVKQTSSGTEHDFFIVPKRCNVCGGQGHVWRKSSCKAELHAFSTVVSERHKKCFKILKYLSEFVHEDPIAITKSYSIKTVVLHHHITCLEDTDDYVECVIQMIRDLMQANENRKLLSYQSNHNILSCAFLCSIPCELLLLRLHSVSEAGSWETFVRRLSHGLCVSDIQFSKTAHGVNN